MNSNQKCKIWIMHLVADDLVSNIIRLGNLLNHRTKTGATHTALLYEKEDGKKFVFEASPSVNTRITNFETYFKEGYIDQKLNYKVAFTPLCGLFNETNTIEKFEEFIKERYLGARYSIKKALNSFQIKDIKPEDVLKAIEDEKEKIQDAQDEQDKSSTFLSKIWHALLRYIKHIIFFILRNKTRQLINKIKEENLDYFVKLAGQFTSSQIDLLYDLDLAESNNTDPKNKFFFCTELVIMAIREWCQEKSIAIPDAINQPIIANLKPEDIYPELLRDSILKYNKDLLVEKITN